MFTELAMAGMVALGTTALQTQNNSAGKAPGQDIGIVVTVVSAGEIDPNHAVPTFNGVPGATVNNWDIAFPTTVLTVGKSYDIEMLANDTSYEGPCKAAFLLTQNQGGKNVVLGKWNFKLGTCQKGVIYGEDTEVKIPKAPGNAVLSGVVTYGSNKSALKIPVVIQ